MKKSRLVVVSILVSVLLAAGGVGYFVWRSLVPSVSADFDGLLRKADVLITRSYLPEAAAVIEQAHRRAVSSAECLRVLKRGYALARKTSDYRRLKTLAVESYERHPSRPELCRVAVLASLRDGDAARALELARGFESLPEIQTLQAEILLGAAAPPDPALAALPDYARYASLDAGNDPERFLAAGRELGDDRFFLDAALLYMAAGNPAKAVEVSRRFLLEPAFDEPAGLIAYEAGLYEEAADRLQRAAVSAGNRADLYIILGDCLFASALPERAAGFYEQALAVDRSYSFVPYLNLARTARRQGFEDKALALLRDAVRRFPESDAASIALASLLFERGDREGACRTLDNYLESDPNNFNVRLLRLRCSAETLSGERFLLRLKDLYFENPKNAPTAAALVSLLLKRLDLSGARAVLTHHQEVSPGGGGTAAISSAAGILAAAAGDLAEASARFTEAVDLLDRWENRYNRAVVLLERGEVRAARADLEQALIDCEMRTRGRAPSMKARIHALRAEVFLKTGDTAEAAREAAKALSLDPTSEAAHLVKRKIDGTRRR